MSIASHSVVPPTARECQTGTTAQPTTDSQSTAAKSQGARRLVVALIAPLSPAEWRRRLLHILPGLLPITLWAIPHQDPLSLTCRAALLGVAVAIAVFAVFWRKRIARSGETNFAAAVLGYLGAVVAMLLLFPARSELGLTVLAILAIGDGSATLAGLWLRGPKLPWNPEKTWAGTLCFIGCAAPYSSLIYFAAARPAVFPHVAALCGVTATALAAISESLPSQVNDNIRVGIAAAVGLIIMHGLLVGWS